MAKKIILDASSSNFNNYEDSFHGTGFKKLESIYQKKISNLEEFKKSILQKAFAGELNTKKAIAI